MRMQMAVVTIANETSPIVHGENGLVGNNSTELIGHLKRLRDDSDLREALGRSAANTVEEQFSEREFIHAWATVLSGAKKNHVSDDFC